MPTHKVARDPIQPWPGVGAGEVVGVTPPERNQERLGDEILGDCRT